MVCKMINIFQVGLMGSGSEEIPECFGVMRNVAPHTYKGNESHFYLPQIKKLVLLGHLGGSVEAT